MTEYIRTMDEMKYRVGYSGVQASIQNDNLVIHNGDHELVIISYTDDGMMIHSAEYGEFPLSDTRKIQVLRSGLFIIDFKIPKPILRIFIQQVEEFHNIVEYAICLNMKLSDDDSKISILEC